MTQVKSDQHGTHTGYTYGCRCDQCVQAESGYRRDRNQLKAIAESTEHRDDTKALRIIRRMSQVPLSAPDLSEALDAIAEVIRSTGRKW
jgi:hypothetical protein